MALTPFQWFLVIMNALSFLIFTVDLFYHKVTGNTLLPKWVYTFVTVFFGSLGVNIYFLIFYRKFSKAGHEYREVRDEKDYYLTWRILAIVMLVIHVIVYLWVCGPHSEEIKLSLNSFVESNKITLVYLLVINSIAFVAFMIDKLNSMNGKGRIRELILLGLAFIGGSVGALLSMEIFHHKTKKMTFAIGVPLIIVMQIIIVVYLLSTGTL